MCDTKIYKYAISTICTVLLESRKTFYKTKHLETLYKAICIHDGTGSYRLFQRATCKTRIYLCKLSCHYNIRIFQRYNYTILERYFYFGLYFYLSFRLCMLPTRTNRLSFVLSYIYKCHHCVELIVHSRYSCAFLFN